jgi:hypothetical protein
MNKGNSRHMDRGNGGRATFKEKVICTYLKTKRQE